LKNLAALLLIVRWATQKSLRRHRFYPASMPRCSCERTTCRVRWAN